jgi:hypothetical protein
MKRRFHDPARKQSAAASRARRAHHLERLLAEFERDGAAAIARARKSAPKSYLKLAACLLSAGEAAPR